MSQPFFGEEFIFTQPDGTVLRVRGWGDQRHAAFTTLDGSLVVREPATGFYRAAAGAGETDEHPLGVARRIAGLVTHGCGERSGGLLRPRWQTRRAQARAARISDPQAKGFLPGPPGRKILGDYLGLCLLVQFPDVQGTISTGQIEAFCNQRGYSEDGNRGSVYDYFFDNSGGRLRYTSIVAPYYTARHPRSYYVDPGAPYGERACELIQEALAHHIAEGLDFSGLSADNGGAVFATNVLYAGRRVNCWQQGLWPHASRLTEPYPLLPGLFVCDYQITELDSAITLGTYCHENGHMLCDFPDLYDLDDDSAGIGAYCLMSGGGLIDRCNPAQICAYLKYRAGWARSVTRVTPGLKATLVAGTHDFFIHAKDLREYFLIENRCRVGRDSALPASGLAIWHVDEEGDNSRQERLPGSHFECALVQADGQYDLEHKRDLGDEGDLFHAGWRNRFADHTSPASRWWDGTSSGLDVSEIGPDGPLMRFSANI